MDALYRFQAISEDDLPLLAQIYASSRHDQLVLASWPAEQRAQFLQQQFEYQHKHYLQAYPEANYDLIYVGEQVIGRLYVNRGTESVHIIDITLLPEFRNQGLGTEIITQLFTEVRNRASGRVLSLSVEKTNNVMSLYHRLGFKIIYDDITYVSMQWQAD